MKTWTFPTILACLLITVYSQTTQDSSVCTIGGIDLVFVLDVSGSIGEDRFQMIREFTGNITSMLLDIGIQRSLVGVILFGDSADVHFPVTQHTDASTLLPALNPGIPYAGESTNTAAGLDLLVSAGQPGGDLQLRDGFVHVAMIITDGQSTDRAATLNAASQLHASNIYEQVYAIGVGGADITELNAIASDPDSEFVFNTGNFDSTGIQEILEDVTQQLCDTTTGTIESNPADSCREIYQLNPTSRGTIDQYFIKTCTGVQEVTCNMKLKCGGLEGGWMQVVDVDMNRNDTCPGTWQNITTPRSLCQGNVAGCSSAHFYMNGITYEHVCGQVVGYQKGSTDAFQSRSSSLDSAYVEGVSITTGSPRKHVWTYAAGLSDDFNYPTFNCPCATVPGPSPPAFVGNDYYCESGDVGTYELTPYYLNDPLWDGNGCSSTNGCCAQIGMPWFYRKLPQQEDDDFEVRICKGDDHNDEDIAIEKVELYVRC